MRYRALERAAVDGVFRDVLPRRPLALSCVNTSGATLEELKRNAQEAVEPMHEDGDQDVRALTHDVDSLCRMFSEDDSGCWLFVNIDLTRIGSKAVRLNISLPDRLVLQINAAVSDR